VCIDFVTSRCSICIQADSSPEPAHNQPYHTHSSERIFLQLQTHGIESFIFTLSKSLPLVQRQVHPHIGIFSPPNPPPDLPILPNLSAPARKRILSPFTDSPNHPFTSPVCVNDMALGRETLRILVCAGSYRSSCSDRHAKSEISPHLTSPQNFSPSPSSSSSSSPPRFPYANRTQASTRIHLYLHPDIQQPSILCILFSTAKFGVGVEKKRKIRTSRTPQLRIRMPNPNPKIPSPISHLPSPQPTSH